MLRRCTVRLRGGDIGPASPTRCARERKAKPQRKGMEGGISLAHSWQRPVTSHQWRSTALKSDANSSCDQVASHHRNFAPPCLAASGIHPLGRLRHQPLDLDQCLRRAGAIRPTPWPVLIWKLRTHTNATRQGGLRQTLLSCPNFYANKKPRQSPGPS